MAGLNRIFLSYASEDKELATAVEDAFNHLAKSTFFDFEIIRDVHSFEQGRSLKHQVLDMLEPASMLFIIYTETLKRSHSWTGFEIGAFSVYMQKDIAEAAHTDRRIVSLFLDDPPDTEVEILGIKLDSSALAGGPDGGNALDPDDGLGKLLRSLSDKSIREVFVARNPAPHDDRRASQLRQLQVDTQTLVDKTIVPALRNSLLKALSSIIQSSAIEQKLLTINWGATLDPVTLDDPLSGSTLSSADNGRDIFRDVFGLNTDQKSLSWALFTRQILASPERRHAPFIINAFQNAVRSAITPGPVDNEQFFVSSRSDLYRIIITRHYSFYDGRRMMHLYFVPMFPKYERDEPSITLALLNVAVRYRTLFLLDSGRLSHKILSASKSDRVGFQNNVQAVVRNILLIEDESHVYGLDDPANYFKYFGHDVDPDQVSDSFLEWKTNKDRILEASSKVLRVTVDDAAFPDLMRTWLREFKAFSGATAAVNERLGTRAAEKMLGWFNVGQTNEGVSKTAASPRPAQTAG